MSVSASTLRRLAALNLAPQAMAEVLSIIADLTAVEEERKAKDRARKIHGKSVESPRKIQETDTENPAPYAGASRAEPETTNSSEDKKKEERKEERKSPPAAVTHAKTLCPIDFQPSERAIAQGRELGLQLPAVYESRDTMVAWSRGNGEKRLDWDAVFANWLRRDAAKARGSPPAKPKGGGWGDIAKFGLTDDPRDDQSGSDYELLPAPSHAH